MVLALYCLQNSMMFTPCWPRAGPTGGAGFAWPAGICSLIIVMTFCAISFPSLQLDDLFEGQFDRRLAPEDRDQDLELALVEAHLADDAGEVRERTLDD